VIKPRSKRGAGFGRTDLGEWSEFGPEDTYTKADVLAYCDHIEACADASLASFHAISLARPWF